MSELWGVEICLFPLTRLIANTTACSYRTSRDHASAFIYECTARYRCRNSASPSNCLPSSLSHASIMWKWLNISSKLFHHLTAPSCTLRGKNATLFIFLDKKVKNQPNIIIFDISMHEKACHMKMTLYSQILQHYFKAALLFSDSSYHR